MASKSKEITKHQTEVLEGMLKQPENRECADCHARGPRWASASLGIFICMRCAGIHRNLGTHITKVKSVNLDKWSDEQLAFIQTMGNAKANAIYEANVPDHYRRPNENDNFGLERWIRDKYERKMFVLVQNVPQKPKKNRSPQTTHYEQPQQPPQQPPPQQSAHLVDFGGFGGPAHHQQQPQQQPAQQQPQQQPFAAFPPPPGSSAAAAARPAPPQNVDFGAFQGAGAAKPAGGPPSGNADFDNFFTNAHGPVSTANNAPPPTKDQLLSLYARPPVAPNVGPGSAPNAPAGPNYNYTGAVQAAPPGYVAVVNPAVPGGIMLVPAASLYGAAVPPGYPGGAQVMMPGQHMMPPTTSAGVPVAYQHASAPATAATGAPNNPNANVSFANLTSPYMGAQKR